METSESMEGEAVKLVKLLILSVVSLWLVGCAHTLPSAQVKALAETLSQEGRSEQDRARDADRKPAQVIGFLGIRPGSTVLDVWSASGYYAEVLSKAVGPKGRVYAQNPDFLLTARGGAASKALDARLANNRLPNVSRLDSNLSALSLEPGSLDAALTALNIHDIVEREGLDGLRNSLATIRRLLKPGGVLGIIDHVGKPGQDNISLHRLDVEQVTPVILEAGFRVSSSDLLRNPEDAYTKNVFEKGVRGKTDRLLLRLTKVDGTRTSGYTLSRQPLRNLGGAIRAAAGP